MSATLAEQVLYIRANSAIDEMVAKVAHQVYGRDLVEVWVDLTDRLHGADEGRALADALAAALLQLLAAVGNRNSAAEEIARLRAQLDIHAARTETETNHA